MQLFESELNGPDHEPERKGDRFDAWARIVINRCPLVFADLLKSHRLSGAERLLVDRLEIEIAGALREAYRQGVEATA